MRRRSSASIAAFSSGSRLRRVATRSAMTFSAVRRGRAAACPSVMALIATFSTPSKMPRSAARMISLPLWSASASASLVTPMVTSPPAVTALGVASFSADATIPRPLARTCSTISSQCSARRLRSSGCFLRLAGGWAATVGFGTVRASAPASGRARAVQSAQDLLDPDRAVEQREAHEHRLEQQLLLRAAPEMRFDLDEHREHAKQVAGGESRLARVERLAEMLGEVGHGTAEHDGKLRAKRVGQAAQQEAEVDAEIGEPSDGRENVARAMLRDDVEQRDVLVLVHEAERVANALRGDV